MNHGDAIARRRRSTGMHAVTLEAPRRTDLAPPSFATVAEDLLDDVYGYLLYLTKNWALAEDLRARRSRLRSAVGSGSIRSAGRTVRGCSPSPARSPRSVPRRDATKASNDRKPARHVTPRSTPSEKDLAGARGRPSRPHGRRARGGRAASRARSHERGSGRTARDHTHRGLDEAAPGTRKAGREDETR